MASSVRSRKLPNLHPHPAQSIEKRHAHSRCRLSSPTNVPSSTLEISLSESHLRATYNRHTQRARKAHNHAYFAKASSHRHTDAITSTAQQSILTESAGCQIPRRLQPPRSRSYCCKVPCAPHTTDTHKRRARHTITHAPKHIITSSHTRNNKHTRQHASSQPLQVVKSRD